LILSPYSAAGVFSSQKAEKPIVGFWPKNWVYADFSKNLGFPYQHSTCLHRYSNEGSDSRPPELPSRCRAVYHGAGLGLQHRSRWGQSGHSQVEHNCFLVLFSAIFGWPWSPAELHTY